MIDLKKEFSDIRDDVFAVISEILESSQYILGKKVSELETRHIMAFPMPLALPREPMHCILPWHPLASGTGTR
jgi:hypothetical protein